MIGSATRNSRWPRVPNPSANPQRGPLKKSSRKTRFPQLWVAVYDLHYPLVDKPTWDALLDFVTANRIDGFLFGGDQFDNQNLSPHTRGKPLLRNRAGFLREVQGFDKHVLSLLENKLSKGAEKIYIIGNHDDWTDQFIEVNPEFDGIQQHKLLRLEQRGWKVIPCGQHFRKGKLTFIHGEQLSGFGNQTPSYHAKKAVEGYCRNILYGHLHTPQTFTKTLPHNERDKWQAWCSPILGRTNPHYLRNRPTSWLNGFTIIEFQKDGSFNLYPIIVSGGTFAYGGRVYGKKRGRS